MNIVLYTAESSLDSLNSIASRVQSVSKGLDYVITSAYGEKGREMDLPPDKPFILILMPDRNAEFTAQIVELISDKPLILFEVDSKTVEENFIRLTAELAEKDVIHSFWTKF